LRLGRAKERKMRVVTFRHETEERLGFLVDDEVVDPKRMAGQAGEAAYGNAIAFIRAGEETRRAADRLIADAPPAARLALAEVKLAAPMRPSTLLCIPPQPASPVSARQ
jgi:hypothetical protein